MHKDPMVRSRLKLCPRLLFRRPRPDNLIKQSPLPLRHQLPPCRLHRVRLHVIVPIRRHIHHHHGRRRNLARKPRIHRSLHKRIAQRRHRHPRCLDRRSTRRSTRRLCTTHTHPNPRHHHRQPQFSPRPDSHPSPRIHTKFPRQTLGVLPPLGRAQVERTISRTPPLFNSQHLHHAPPLTNTYVCPTRYDFVPYPPRHPVRLPFTAAQSLPML